MCIANFNPNNLLLSAPYITFGVELAKKRFDYGNGIFQ